MHSQQTFRAVSSGARTAHPEFRVLPRAEAKALPLDRSQALVHDLRGMIAIIESCAATLEAVGSGSGAPLPSELIHRILRACKTMTMFVDDCLTQARSQVLENTVAERLDLVQLINETVGLHQAAARQKNITLDAGYSSRHQTLRGNATFLQRALSNLLTNAIKFSPSGSTVSLAVRDEPAAVRILVADEGPGISQSELSTLFDPYVQGRAEPTGGERGHGMGLAIAKGFVEAQGGRISVSSEVGHGSVFIITLPL